MFLGVNSEKHNCTPELLRSSVVTRSPGEQGMNGPGIDRGLRAVLLAALYNTGGWGVAMSLVGEFPRKKRGVFKLSPLNSCPCTQNKNFKEGPKARNKQ
jgi:hypothetical protein